MSKKIIRLFLTVTCIFTLTACTGSAGTVKGRDGIEAKNIYMEQEVNGKIQTQTFYAIPVSQGSLLVEIGGYMGMPEKAEAAFEEMLGSFALETK